MKGLIDTETDDEFDEKLGPLVKVWNERETHHRNLKSINDCKFASYFVKNISVDMKRKMIYGVRRELMRFGDNFFYNNASESVNDRIKKFVNQRNAEMTTSGKPNSKCSWVEFASLYKVSYLYSRTSIEAPL